MAHSQCPNHAVPSNLSLCKENIKALHPVHVVGLRDAALPLGLDSPLVPAFSRQYVSCHCHFEAGYAERTTLDAD